MFDRRGGRRKAKPWITVLDARGEAIVDCPLSDFALPEATVLALSVEYFADPEPCEIHRAAVHKRAMMELLAHYTPDTNVPITALNVEHRRFFAPEARFVRLEERC